MATPETPKPGAIVLSERAKVYQRLSDYFSIKSCRELLQGAISAESGLTVERCTQAAIAAVIREEYLWGCTSQSIFDCVLAATQLQMLVGKELGHAYLVPFKDVCTLVLGYKGIVTLARRSGEIKSIEARVVYQKELATFEIEYGTNGHLRHLPIPFGDRGKPVGVYMFATFTGGGTHVEPMSIDECLAVRERSKAKEKGPWALGPKGELTSDVLEMCRKTVVKRGCKMLPLMADAVQAIADDDDREFNEARDVTTPRATTSGPALPSQASGGGERIRTPTQADKVREEVGVRASTSSTPVNEETGETTLDPEPAAKTEPAAAEKPKPSRKAAEPKPDVVQPGPAEAPAKKADPGAGLAEASTLIDNADAATEADELDQIRGQLDAAVAAGRIGVTHATRVQKAIDSAKARI